MSVFPRRANGPAASQSSHASTDHPLSGVMSSPRAACKGSRDRSNPRSSENFNVFDHRSSLQG
ncbi:hypothetical protein Pd630_LPD02378 [Rhodococcus opacus PD630]|nr:hypothetical protein Pd630_LPD02378 [Rhodococcus opacus PD630]